jgi:hypothetical protein
MRPRRSYIGWTDSMPQMIMVLHIKAADADPLYVWIFGEVLHGTLLQGIPVELRVV